MSCHLHQALSLYCSGHIAEDRVEKTDELENRKEGCVRLSSENDRTLVLSSFGYLHKTSIRLNQSKFSHGETRGSCCPQVLAEELLEADGC